MLTLFSIPRPFRGNFKVIQMNAIKSWLHLDKNCEIILLGDELGTKELVNGLGTRHIPKVKRNEYGTPLVNDLFELAQRHARYDLLCYVNADIILMSDFLKAVKLINQGNSSFLMMGQRWDVDISTEINFNDPEWEGRLSKVTLKNGVLHPHTGIDYFIFRRGLWTEIPAFTIGRTVWDHWLIYQARVLGVPVLDATQTIMAVHQNHSLPLLGPEAANNRKIAVTYPFSYLFTLKDATHLLTPSGPIRALDLKHLYRKLFMYPIKYMRSTHFIWLSDLLLKTALRLGKRDKAIERSIKSHSTLTNH